MDKILSNTVNLYLKEITLSFHELIYKLQILYTVLSASYTHSRGYL